MLCKSFLTGMKKYQINKILSLNRYEKCYKIVFLAHLAIAFVMGKRSSSVSFSHLNPPLDLVLT